jgi:hypothetical protein
MFGEDDNSLKTKTSQDFFNILFEFFEKVKKFVKDEEER